jgi:integrase
MARLSVRVKWWRNAWWVWAQGPQIKNKSGKQAKRIGPTDEDRVRAEAVARALRESCDDTKPGRLDPLPTDRTLERWIETYRRTLKPSTEQTTRSLIRRHLVPYFGSRDLREIAEADLLAFADKTIASGRSVKLVKNALGVLRRVINLAIRDGLIDRNPAARLGEIMRGLANREATEVRQVDAWTHKEVAEILDLAREKEPRVYPVLVLLFQTGVRRGEALGLQWRDVDFERDRVEVRRSRVRDRTSTPKSGRGRQVVMSETLARTLHDLQAEQRRRHPYADPDGWVFTSRDGLEPMGETVFSRAWQRLRRYFEPRGIRPLTLHSARHTWATLALQARKSVRWVAEQLGHSDPAFTLRVYAHAVPGEEVDLSFLEFEAGFQTGNQEETEPRGRQMKLRSKSANSAG